MSLWVPSMDPWGDFVSDHRTGTLVDARTGEAMELRESVMLPSLPHIGGGGGE